MGKIIIDYEKHYESFFGRYWGLIIFPLLPFWLLGRDDGMAGYLDIDGKAYKLKYKKKNHPQIIDIDNGIHEIIYRKKSKFAIAFNLWTRSSGGTLDRVLDNMGAYNDYKLDGFMLNFGSDTHVKLHAEGGILRKCKVVDIVDALEMPKEEKSVSRKPKVKLGCVTPIIILVALMALGLYASNNSGKMINLINGGGDSHSANIGSSQTEIQQDTDTPDKQPEAEVQKEPSVDKHMFVSANGGLNLRESASTDSPVLVLIPKETEIIVEKLQNGWAKTQYQGKTGWCSAEYLVDNADSLKGPEEEKVLTREQIDNARAAADEIIDSYYGKKTKGARTDITVDNVVEFFETAQNYYNYWMNFGGQFEKLIELKDEENYFLYLVEDSKCKTVQDVCDRYFSLFSDNLAKECLTAKLYSLDGKLAITSHGAGVQGLYISHTYDVQKVSDTQINVSVIIKQYDNYQYTETGELDPNVKVIERILTYPCVVEDGAWVFSEMGTIYS